MIFVFLRESGDGGIVESCPQVVFLGYRVELLAGVLIAIGDLFCFFYGVAEGVIFVGIPGVLEQVTCIIVAIGFHLAVDGLTCQSVVAIVDVLRLDVFGRCRRSGRCFAQGFSHA